MSLLLGVNVDHVATLRQARYALLPDSPNAEPCPVQASLDAIAGGADSITIHVRGDRRHMQEADTYRIKDAIQVPLNLENSAICPRADSTSRSKSTRAG